MLILVLGSGRRKINYSKLLNEIFLKIKDSVRLAQVSCSLAESGVKIISH